MASKPARTRKCRTNDPGLTIEHHLASLDRPTDAHAQQNDSREVDTSTHIYLLSARTHPFSNVRNGQQHRFSHKTLRHIVWRDDCVRCNIMNELAPYGLGTRHNVPRAVRAHINTVAHTRNGACYDMHVCLAVCAFGFLRRSSSALSSY